MKRLKKNNSGLTLVETVVTLAITAIVLVSLFSLYTVFSRRYPAEAIKAKELAEIQTVTSLINTKIAECDSYVYHDNYVVNGKKCNILVLRMNDSVNGIRNIKIFKYLGDDNLYIQVDNNDNTILCENIKYFGCLVNKDLHPTLATSQNSFGTSFNNSVGYIIITNRSEVDEAKFFRNLEGSFAEGFDHKILSTSLVPVNAMIQEKMEGCYYFNTYIKKEVDMDYTLVNNLKAKEELVTMKTGDTFKNDIFNKLTGASHNSDLVWFSSNEAVAHVDEYGSVRALAVGTSTIKAVDEEGRVVTYVVIVVPEPVYGNMTGWEYDDVTGTITGFHGDVIYSDNTYISDVTVPNIVSGDYVHTVDYTGGEFGNVEILRIADGITALQPYSFSECYAVKEIHIPDTLGEIYPYSFAGCSGVVVYVSENNVAARTWFTNNHPDWILVNTIS